MTLSLLVILALAGFMQATRSFAAHSQEPVAGAATALAAGFILLIAFFSGRVFSGLRLPKLTGYIAAGVVVGPQLMGLVTEPVVADLRFISGVAICLIALTAGIETDLRSLKPLMRAIGWISAVAIMGTILLLAGAVLLMRAELPFMVDMSWPQAVAVALVLGVTLSAQSPAVVIALRKEMSADGPMMRTVLGVVVIADLLVILCFAITSSVAQALLGNGPDVVATVQKVLWELLGSMAGGVIAGAILVVYLRKVRGGESMFLLALCVVVAEVGQRIHLDPLLVALTCGIFVKNIAHEGDRLLESIEATSLPVYVIFFALAGATLHLDVLWVVGLPAAALVVTRALGFIGGTMLGASIAQAPSNVVRYAAFGLIPQAGLALALALLFARTFPQFGQAASALTLGIVALNELIAPILFRWALVRTGEARQQSGTTESWTTNPFGIAPLPETTAPP